MAELRAGRRLLGAWVAGGPVAGPLTVTAERGGLWALGEGGRLYNLAHAEWVDLEPETPKTKPAGRRGKPERAEIDWRVDRCWALLLEARKRWHEREGIPAGHEPSRTPEIEAAIEAALLVHDRERLGAETRKEWERLSPVRAAGVGMFLSEWNTGRAEGSDGRRYLEPWRPWKRQRGKPDPVETYAPLYFEARQLKNGGGER